MLCAKFNFKQNSILISDSKNNDSSGEDDSDDDEQIGNEVNI